MSAPPYTEPPPSYPEVQQQSPPPPGFAPPHTQQSTAPPGAWYHPLPQNQPQNNYYQQQPYGGYAPGGAYQPQQPKPYPTAQQPVYGQPGGQYAQAPSGGGGFQYGQQQQPYYGPNAGYGHQPGQQRVIVVKQTPVQQNSGPSPGDCCLIALCAMCCACCLADALD